MNLTSPKKWKTADLGQVIDLIIDHRGLTPLKLGGNWVESGYRALSAKNIKTGQIIQDGPVRFIDEGLYKRWMPVEIERGDILLTSEGPLGEYFLWDSDEKIVLSQRLFGIRTNKKILDPKFFYYLLGTPFYKGELFGRATGTTVEGIKQSELLKTKVIFPESLDDQREIAAILGSLDNKIELLRRENKTLESIAQTLFRDWFVEFKFPGYEEVKVVGGVPEGWKIGKLGEVCKINYGKNLPTDKLSKSGYPVFGGNGLIGFHDKYIYEEQKVLVSCRGEASGKINISDPYSFVTNNSLILEQDEKQISFEYLKYMSLFTSYYDYVTGSAQPQITIDSLQICPILVPDKKTIDLFSYSVKPIQGKLLNNAKEIQTLSRLRDDLLNKIFNV